MTKTAELESRGNVFTLFTGCAQIYHQRWYVRSPRGKFRLHGLLVDKRNRKQWKCQTVESTDWNSRENAKMWRKDLADTINATNE